MTPEEIKTRYAEILKELLEYGYPENFGITTAKKRIREELEADGFNRFQAASMTFNAVG